MIYAITDRWPLERIAVVLAAGVDYLQIREKHLTAGELYTLVKSVLALPKPAGTRILVNERADVALAAGAHGVHLPGGSPSAARIRAIAAKPFLLGVSCHSAEEVARAEEEGADVAVFGPVFETASKRAYGPPQGVEALERAAHGRRIPVLALGGITLENFRSCRAAAGIAAISLFGNAPDPAVVVRTLRG